jgi:hypothetical protein
MAGPATGPASARIAAVFSGGTYDEVARWLWNFLTAHAKRVDPRFEVELDAADEREGKSYGARLSFFRHLGATVEFEFRDVADNRGSLAWCSALAERTRALARELIASTRGVTDVRTP